MFPQVRVVVANGAIRSLAVKDILAAIVPHWLADPRPTKKLRPMKKLRVQVRQNLSSELNEAHARGSDDESCDESDASCSSLGASSHSSYSVGRKGAAGTSGAATLYAEMRPSIYRNEFVSSDVASSGGPVTKLLSSALHTVADDAPEKHIATVLLIHSLDQLLRRKHGALPALLNLLLGTPSLRIVGTMDHMNAPLLVSDASMLQGKFVSTTAIFCYCNVTRYTFICFYFVDALFLFSIS